MHSPKFVFSPDTEKINSRTPFQSRLIVAIFLFLFSLSATFGQKVVFNEDFSAFNDPNYNISGAIGLSPNWSLVRSGDDFGARINAGILDLSNDATSITTPNVNGWVFASTFTSGFLAPFNNTLDANQSTILWSFNMRQSRSDPSGFSGSSGTYGYGVAFILAGTTNTTATTGQGYAVILGSPGSTDPIQLVKYSAGIESQTVIRSGNNKGFEDFGSVYLSYQIFYSPVTHEWSIYARNDGPSAFTDPTISTDMVFLGKATDLDYTNIPLTKMGGLWHASTLANQKAYFDNIQVGLLPLNPDAQSMTLSQDFGVSPSSTYPVSFYGWSGIDGSLVDKLLDAEATNPEKNATLGIIPSAIGTAPSGGLYSVGTGNTKICVATSNDPINGLNQPVAAVATGVIGERDFYVSYDLDVLFPGQRTMGMALQYRNGLTGTWTTVTESPQSYPASPAFGSKITKSLFFRTSFKLYGVVQFRWISWRKDSPGISNTSIGLDNVSISGSSNTANVGVSSSPPVSSGVNPGTTDVILQRIDLAVTEYNTVLNGLYFTTEGNYTASDLANIKIRYSTDATLNPGDATLATKTFNLGPGGHSFPNTAPFQTFSNQSINQGNTGYIFITADIAPNPDGPHTINLGPINLAHIDIPNSSGTKLGTFPLAASNAITILGKPVLESPPTAAPITSTSELLAGNATSTGGSSITKRGFYYRLSSLGALADGAGTEVSTSGPFGAGPFTQNPTGLSAATSYYFKSFATNVLGVSYSTQGSFTTLKAVPTNNPGSFACGTTAVTSIPLTWTDVAAGPIPDGYLIRWSIVSSVAIVNPPVADAANEKIVGPGVQSALISGLAPGTTYYFKIFPFTNSGLNILYKTATVSATFCITQTGPWETFEPSLKSTYAVGDISGTSGTWELTEAVIGSTPNDRKSGSKSVRLRNSGGTVRMRFDIPFGVGSVTVSHGKYGLEANSTWKLQSSTDGGFSWTDASPASVTTTSSVLSATTFTVNKTGNVRLQFVKLTDNNQVNLDDISYTINLPCSLPPTTSSVSGSNRNTTGFDLSWTGSAGNGTMVVLRRINQTHTYPVSGTTYVPNTAWASAGQINTNNRVVYRNSGSSVTGISGLTSGVGYRATAYNYNTAGNCYQTDNPAGTDVYTLALKPLAHAAAFSATPIGYNQINLSFSAASTITNAKGYIILRRIGALPDVMPVDGQSYVVGDVLGNGTVAAIVNSTSPITASALGLIALQNYRFLLIPFGRGTGGEAQTYNYYTAATIPTTNATTYFQPSLESDIQVDPFFVYTSNINYSGYQSAAASSVANSVAVMSFYVRDGSGSADADVLPTILDKIQFYGSGVESIRAAALFGGPSQTTFIANGNVLFGAGVDFTNLGGLGTNITAADNGSVQLTLRVTYNASVTDNSQLSLSISPYSTFAANFSTSSFFKIFPDPTSSILGDRNRIEVTATTIAFGSQPTTSFINTNISKFNINAVDALGNTDLDQNTCTVALTKSFSTLGSLSSATPYTFSSGQIQVTTAKLNIAQLGAKIVATAQSCLGSTVITSNAFDITDVVYQNNDWRCISNASAKVWGTAANWEKYNAGTWSAAGGSPGAGTRVYIQGPGSMSTNGSRTVGEIIILFNTVAGGNLIVTATSTCTGNVTVMGTGTLTLNADLAIAGNFQVENNASVFVNFATANNTSGLWSGTEIFKETSLFTIQNWETSHVTVESRPVVGVSNISSNTYGGYDAYFGELKIDCSSLTTDLIVMSPSHTAQNIAHGDLTVLQSGGFSVVICANGNGLSTGIGGNLSVTGNLKFALDGTISFYLNGNLTVNSFGNVSATSSVGADASCFLTTKGNLTLGTNSNFYMNSSSSFRGSVEMELLGDISVAASANLRNSATPGNGTYNLYLTGDGDGSTAAQTQEIDIASTSLTNENTNIAFLVSGGTYARLKNQNLELGQGSQFAIYPGGTLDFGFSAGNVPLAVGISGSSTGTSFYSFSNSTLKITSPDGLSLTGSIGNVQVEPANRYFDQTCTFWFNGKVNQTMGSGITNLPSVKSIVCALNTNSLTLTPSNNIVISSFGSLDIRTGTVVETEGASFSGNGFLSMASGTSYRSGVRSAIVPQLDDYLHYQLTGGTIELNALGNQVISGQPQPYYNISISGSGNKTTSGALIVSNNLSISAAILDVGTYGVRGGGGLSMTGGTLRIKKNTGATVYPELLGSSSNPYSLVGGTIDLYGTSASETQIIRTTYGPSLPLTYYNLSLNSSAENNVSSNFIPESGFSVSGTFQVFSPSVFELTSTQIVGGGSFVLDSAATLKYAHRYGITPSACGLAFTCGQIRSTTRNFKNGSMYYLTGNILGMVTGSGFPERVTDLIITRGGNPVTLSQDVKVHRLLIFDGTGNLETNGNKLTLGSDATIAELENSHVSGTVETTRVLSTTSQDFGGLGVEIDADGAAPGLTVVSRYTGAVTSLGAEGILRKFSITPTTNSGLDATLTMKYFDDEINGLDETNFKLYRSTDSGITWIEQTSVPDPAMNQVTKSGINAFSEWTVGDLDVPLPLSLISFTGKASDAKADLFWKTASEEDNTVFNVYRSIDGQYFDLIGSTKGIGRNGGYTYSLTDQNFKQSYFYKLVAFNSDVKRETDSKTIFLNCNCGNELKIIVFPNPSSGAVTLQSNQNVSDLEVFDLELIGMDGRRIFENHANLKSQEGVLNNRLSVLSSGLYQIRIHNDRYHEVLKIRKF